MSEQARRLSQFVALMNTRGVDSRAVRDWFEANQDNPELLELAQLSVDLKKAFTHERTTSRWEYFWLIISAVSWGFFIWMILQYVQMMQ